MKKYSITLITMEPQKVKNFNRMGIMQQPLLTLQVNHGIKLKMNKEKRVGTLLRLSKTHYGLKK
jgi:hypothetical protein